MTVLEAPSARDLRRQVRSWRRGRAELSWWEVFNDAYIALFSVVMVGAMAGNVVLGLRGMADVACTGLCTQTRSLAPWLAALAVAAMALGAARLLGPVFSPPAANAWVLASPVDRGDALRPGWLRTAAVTVLASAGLLVAPALLGGFGAATTAGYLVAGSSASLACVALAALSQVHEHRAARWATWLIVASLWLTLGLAAGGRAGGLPATDHAIVFPVAGALVAAAAWLAWRAVTSLTTMTRRVLGFTEHLSPALSGALSSLDLGLMYDVLLARRWGKAASVRSRRGGPRGWWALAHRDLLRAARTPQPFVVLAGMVLLPYAAAAADAGRVVVLVTTLGGLLVGPSLCTGLRVVVRTGGIARMLPFDTTGLRSAHAVVPATALIAYGLATRWSLPSEIPSGEAFTIALACGLSSLAATVRWVTARPPDYGRPMVSTPAGAVPPGVAAGVFRGFDIWAITALPLMFGTAGMLGSMALSIATLSYLVSTEPE